MYVSYFLGSFVRIAHAASERQKERLNERGQVVAEQRDGTITIRYADGVNVPSTTFDVAMDADQTTPVWPPRAPEQPPAE